MSKHETANAIHAEFIGGPNDGHSRWMPADTEAVTFGRMVDREYSRLEYRRRRVNGIAVKLPSGRTPYDFRPGL